MDLSQVIYYGSIIDAESYPEEKENDNQMLQQQIEKRICLREKVAYFSLVVQMLFIIVYPIIH
jgi:cell division protein FtsL